MATRKKSILQTWAEGESRRIEKEKYAGEPFVINAEGEARDRATLSKETDAQLRTRIDKGRNNGRPHKMSYTDGRYIRAEDAQKARDHVDRLTREEIRSRANPGSIQPAPAPKDSRSAIAAVTRPYQPAVDVSLDRATPAASPITPSGIERVVGNYQNGQMGVDEPLWHPMANKTASPVLPGIMAQAKTADENMAEVNALREKARANGTLIGQSISGMSNNVGPGGTASRLSAFATRAGGPIAPASSEPFVPASQALLDKAIAIHKSYSTPSAQAPGVVPSATPPVVQQEPKPQPSPGLDRNMEAAREAVANGVKNPGQRQQSTASFVLKQPKSPSQLPGLNHWSKGNNPNSIKPAQGVTAMPNRRTGINSSYDPNFEA